MKNLRTIAAAVAAGALGAGLGANAAVASASVVSAPAAVSVSVKAPTLMDRKFAAQKAYADAQRALVKAKRAKKPAKVIKAAQASVTRAYYLLGEAIVNVGVAKQILSKDEVAAVNAYAVYMGRVAKANPKNALIARRAKVAQVAAKAATAQIATPRVPTAPTPGTPPNSNTPGTPADPVKVVPYVLPKLTAKSTSCTKAANGRFDAVTTFSAVGGKYTDFGGPEGKKFALVDGGTSTWYSRLSIASFDLGPGNVVSRGMTPVRDIGDFGAAFDSKRVSVDMLPGMSHRLSFTCPAVDAATGESITTAH